MPRTKTRHRLLPAGEWRKLVAAAWNALDHGKKAKVQQRAELGRGTVHRIVSDDPQVDYDALEKLRLAINAEHRNDAIPEPFVCVRSASHARALAAASALDDAAADASATAWLELGRVLADSGQLDRVIADIADKLSASSAEQQSAPSPDAGEADLDARREAARASVAAALKKLRNKDQGRAIPSGTHGDAVQPTPRKVVPARTSRRTGG